MHAILLFLGKNVDLGNLYDFVAQLKKLSITDYISQISNGEQHEISFTFDLGIFFSLTVLQVSSLAVFQTSAVYCLVPELPVLSLMNSAAHGY